MTWDKGRSSYSVNDQQSQIVKSSANSWWVTSIVASAIRQLHRSNSISRTIMKCIISAILSFRQSKFQTTRAKHESLATAMGLFCLVKRSLWLPCLSKSSLQKEAPGNHGISDSTTSVRSFGKTFLLKGLVTHPPKKTHLENVLKSSSKRPVALPIRER